MSFFPLDVSSPQPFTYISGQTYFTEKLSFELLSILSALTVQEAQIPFVTLGESQALDTDVSAYFVDVAAWLSSADSIVAANEADGTSVSIPAPPSLPAIPGEPLQIVLLKLALRFAADLFLTWLKNRKRESTGKGFDDFLYVFKAAFTYAGVDSEGKEVLVSVLKKIAEKNEIKIDFDDGAVTVYPSSMTVEYVDEIP